MRFRLKRLPGLHYLNFIFCTAHILIISIEKVIRVVLKKSGFQSGSQITTKFCKIFLQNNKYVAKAHCHMKISNMRPIPCIPRGILMRPLTWRPIMILRNFNEKLFRAKNIVEEDYEYNNKKMGRSADALFICATI